MKLASICSLVLALLLIGATAKPQAAEPAKEKPKFELLDGDRVVLLGGTLIEREQKYGWWELMLTCAYPDRHIVFRNLGWSGDTVWGESRAGFDPPAKGYDKLLAQVAAVKPTVIILGYGNVEAHAGASEIPRFIAQYEKLLDDLKTVSAPGVRFLVISPMLMEKMDPPLPDPAEYNAKVVEYRKAIEGMAESKKYLSVRPRLDAKLWKAIDPDVRYASDQTLDEGLSAVSLCDESGHFSDHGFKISSTEIEAQLSKVLGYPEVALEPFLSFHKNEWRPYGIEKPTIERTPQLISIQMLRYHLSPFPLKIYIEDLANDSFDLRCDGKHIERVKRSQLANSPHEFASDADSNQWAELRRLVLRKNFLYFNAYRPQNDTYLFGFRKKEQGNNAAEVAELLKLVEELDRDITKLKKPQPHTYELIRIGDAKAEDKVEEKR